MVTRDQRTDNHASTKKERRECTTGPSQVQRALGYYAGVRARQLQELAERLSSGQCTAQDVADATELLTDGDTSNEAIARCVERWLTDIRAWMREKSVCQLVVGAEPVRSKFEDGWLIESSWLLPVCRTLEDATDVMAFRCAAFGIERTQDEFCKALEAKRTGRRAVAELVVLGRQPRPTSEPERHAQAIETEPEIRRLVKALSESARRKRKKVQGTND